MVASLTRRSILASGNPAKDDHHSRFLCRTVKVHFKYWPRFNHCDSSSFGSSRAIQAQQIQALAIPTPTPHPSHPPTHPRPPVVAVGGVINLAMGVLMLASRQLLGPFLLTKPLAGVMLMLSIALGVPVVTFTGSNGRLLASGFLAVLAPRTVPCGAI